MSDGTRLSAPTSESTAVCCCRCPAADVVTSDGNLWMPALQRAVFTNVVSAIFTMLGRSNNVCATAAGSAFNLLSALESKVDADQQQTHRKPRGLALPAGNDSLHLAGKTKAPPAPLQAASPFTRSPSCASLSYCKSLLESGSSAM